MPKFIIYPKGDDTEHTVVFERYALKDIPRPNDDADQFAADGYLHFANIAAIIPKRRDPKIRDTFYVYLKNRKDPVEVLADKVEVKGEPPSLTFYYLLRPSTDRYEELKNVYVALSEVVAITPGDKT